MAEVEHFSKAQSALDAYRLRIASRIDSLNDAGLDAAEVFRSVCRVSSRRAQRDSRTASRMADLPSTAGKLAELATNESVDIFAKHAREWVAAKESEEEEEASRQARQYGDRSFKKWTDDPGTPPKAKSRFDGWTSFQGAR